MNVKQGLLIAAVAASMLLATGCGSANHASSTGNSSANTSNTASTQSTKTTTPDRTVMVGASGYSGLGNLDKFEKQAKAHPTDYKAQLDAGVSAFDNGKLTLAIHYYEKAAKLKPSAATPVNNIGNVYYRPMKLPAKALPYYQKAVKINPKDGVAWLNLIEVEGTLGHNSAAKSYAVEALKVVPKSNAYYSSLQTALKKMK